MTAAQRTVEAMNQFQLVTVAKFEHAAAAWLLKNRLEEAGIEAFVTDEFIEALKWHFNIVAGGVKVKVRQFNVNDAQEILKSATEGEILKEPEVPIDRVDEEHERNWIQELMWRRINRSCSLKWIFVLGFPLPVV